MDLFRYVLRLLQGLYYLNGSLTASHFSHSLGIAAEIFCLQWWPYLRRQRLRKKEM